MDNLTTLKLLGTLSCAASNGFLIRPQHTMQILSMEGFPHFDHLSHYTIVLKENNRIHYLFCQTKRMFTCELLLNARTCKWRNRQCLVATKWELPEGTSFAVNWKNLSCGQRIFATQHRPEDQAVCAAQHSTELALLRSTVTWITDFSVNDLPVFQSGTIGLHVKFFTGWLSSLCKVRKNFFQSHISSRNVPLKISTGKKIPQYQKYIHRVESYKVKYQWKLRCFFTFQKKNNKKKC